MSHGMGGPGLRGADDEQLFYEDLIAGYVHSDGYVRRTWLEQEVIDRLGRPECQYVLLVAEPGAGKTGLMAGLADRNPQWLRYFNRRDSTTPLSGGDATSALIRIGHQFAARQPALFDPQRLEVVVNQRVTQAGPESSVVGVRIEDLHVSPFHRTAIRVSQEIGGLNGHLVGVEVTNATLEPRLLAPETLQYLALIDPAVVLGASQPGEHVVVLVDALDEVFRFRGGMSILDWLESGPELPPNVRFVVSSRPHPRLKAFEGARAGSIEVIRLDAASAGVLDDTREFSRHLLAVSIAEEHLPDHDAAAERLAQASEGNFAYLTAYARALRSAMQDDNEATLDDLLRLDELPKGLGALYATFLRNVREEINLLGGLDVESPVGPADRLTPAWEGAGQRMLGVLAVARAPMTLEQLMNLGGIRVWRSAAISVLQRLTPFLDEVGVAWQLFHPSVAEFLTRDAVEEAPDLGVEGDEWHRRIVRAYQKDTSWDKVGWESIDDYGLLHLVEHLVELGDASRNEVKALVNPSLRAASRKRFLTDLPFKRIVEIALAEANKEADPGKALAATLFLDVVRTELSSSERLLAPAVFGLMAKLGRLGEADARVQLLLPSEHQFTALQAIVACTPAAQRPLLGAHDGADRLVAAALEMPVARNKAIKAAAETLAPYDLDRALATAAEAENDGAHNVHDSVVAAAVRAAGPASALGLLDRLHEGRATVAVDVAQGAELVDRERLLLFAEQHLDAETLQGRITALAGLVAGWHQSDQGRSANAALELRAMIQQPLEQNDSSGDRRRAMLEAASMVRLAEPDLAVWLLDRIEEVDSTNSWVMTRAAALWAAWGERDKCRKVAERVLTYERSLGWYGPAANIAALAVAVNTADPAWALELADEAEGLIVKAAGSVHDPFERSRVDATLGEVARAFSAWDRERALRVGRLMGGSWIRGGSWDSFHGRSSVLACIGIDASDTDIDLARDLLDECAPDQAPAAVLGRHDPKLIRGGLFRPAEGLVSKDEGVLRTTNFIVFIRNSVNYWFRGRDWRWFVEPAEVARSIGMPPGSAGAVASWAGVIAAAIEPVAKLDRDMAIDLAGWPSDSGERLIACAALVRALTEAGDGRAAAALDALDRAAVSLPRYVAELDLEKVDQGPVLAYLNPSVRARWEAALLLPSNAMHIAEELSKATDSWYLDATLRAQRLWELILAKSPEGWDRQTIMESISRGLSSMAGYPDDIQSDLVRVAAALALSRFDATQAEAIAATIQHPGRALLARIHVAAMTADADAVPAACRATLESAPADLSVLDRAAAAATATALAAGEDKQGALDLTDIGVAALEGADALSATWGLVMLAAKIDGPRRVFLLHEALRRAEEVGNVYLRNDVLASMLEPATLTNDSSVITMVARRLLAADWQVLMEGLRRAIGPLVTLAGPGLLTQLDEALWAAQQVVGANGPPKHLDAVASPPLRVQVLTATSPEAGTVDTVGFDVL
ncbi:hypothetical protein [Arthrobacter sunyaminii]|uniref:Uncharacterized protein n=1 Tax=Arthrobacter sunyaminii TaxID=2816859 RepID=A0A975S7X5_9MICC|nr:hypothetical protein [Arthrobacter sunyaminii]MBO0906689.1 hypothetical protein [Arthrobacter sunyaminii]QWQ37466.1 hypothetical protein KG104_06965 [Arthrobacter sunyaminii]